MFKGIGAVQPFSFSFSGGVVTGPNFSFDIKGPLSGASPAQKAFFCSNPGMLIDYVYNAWNEQFNPQCKIEGGGWNSGCLQITGTPNLLSNAGMAIQSQIAEWGKSYLGANCTPQDHTANPPPSGGAPPPNGDGHYIPPPNGSTAPNPFDSLLSTPVLLIAGGFVLLMMLRK